MLQALLSGIASIKAQQLRMNIIGNNLANVNTTAYKSSSVSFEDMISQTYSNGTKPTTDLGGRNPVQFGLGVSIGGTNVDNTQGSLNATNRPTDLAIQGAGYFMVSNGQFTSYTRDGSFGLDANGDLIMQNTGQRVLGWQADAAGNVDTTVPVDPSSRLNIPLGGMTAVKATSKVTMAGNLDAGATPTDTWTTSVRVYDSIGGAHDITIQLLNRATPPTAPSLPVGATAPAGAVSSWDWKAFEGSVATGTPIGDSTTAGNSPLYFDANGATIPVNGNIETMTVPAGAAGTAAFPVTLDFSKISQLNTTTQVNTSDQDGFPPGSLQGFSIGNDGTILGTFTNGLTRNLGVIAMANFSNADGLSSLGGNLWASTVNSGMPIIGQPSQGGNGVINSGFLEQSNVDIGTQFTDLIVTQRGFQANTKVVTTVDEMLQNLIDMKR